MDSNHHFSVIISNVFLYVFNMKISASNLTNFCLNFHLRAWFDAQILLCAFSFDWFFVSVQPAAISNSAVWILHPVWLLSIHQRLPLFLKVKHLTSFWAKGSLSWDDARREIRIQETLCSQWFLFEKCVFIFYSAPQQETDSINVRISSSSL